MLACLTEGDLALFIEITQMEVMASVGDTVILKGYELFTYVYDYSQALWCLS